MENLLNTKSPEQFQFEKLGKPEQMTLLLEDDEERIKWFKSKIPWIYITKTAHDCKQFLQKYGGVDILFLDHDLGGEIYIDSNSENCGMEIVRYIQMYRPIINKIIIHSHNDFGAELMIDQFKYLLDYYVVHIPFIKLVELWDEIDPDKE